MKELINKPAMDVVNLLRKKEVSPLELLDVAERRILDVEGAVNAMPTLCFDRARKHAKNIMDNPPDAPPPHYLYGLPIAVKDLDDVKGVRTTFGSLVLENNVSERSDIMVEILEENGAVVIGKSNTPEFGAGGNTFNDVFGVTLNPWDTRKTCGGSSGGSAVALATGEVWLATGSDLAGSLRTPASYCSIVGFRPSPGRVPNGPRTIAYESLAVHGPMARTVTDTALMLDAMVGRHPGDPMALPRSAESYLHAVERPFKPRRVAFCPDIGGLKVQPEVEDICLRGAESFSELGCVVEQVRLPLDGVEKVFHVLRANLFAAHIGRKLIETMRDKIKPEVVWNVEMGLALGSEEIAAAEKGRSEIIQRFQQLFSRYDLLLCPAVSAKPFDVNIRYLDELEGQKFETYFSWLMPTFAVTLSSCPAMSLPCGFSWDALPVGLQLVAPFQREDLLLGAAALFEDMHGLHLMTPIDPRTP